MTLSVREGRLPIASLLMCDFFVFVVHSMVHLHLQSFLSYLSIKLN